MRSICFGTCAFLALSSLSLAQMTHEESVVRAAYAKLSYAVEQLPISQLAMEATGIPIPREAVGLSNDQRIANSQLSIRLSDFVVGKAKDILTRKAVDLITPAQERLEVQGGRHSFISHGQEFQWYEPRASWEAAVPVPRTVADLTLLDFFYLQWQQKHPESAWQTYASYSVTVSYQGTTVGPYKALFMFGHDSNGAERIEPEDGTIDATALVAAMHEHLFADAFVSSILRDVPVVAQWVDTKQQAQNCSEEQGVCCDLSSLRCGPNSSTIEKARSTPLRKGDAQ